MLGGREWGPLSNICISLEEVCMHCVLGEAGRELECDLHLEFLVSICSMLYLRKLVIRIVHG